MESHYNAIYYNIILRITASMDDDDVEFRFNDMSIHEGHSCQNGILIWFGIEMAITSQVCMKI